MILPLTVLRRVDCVLAPTKQQVLQRQAELRQRGLEELDQQLRHASGFAFYNTSRYDFDRLLADAPQLAGNLRNFIAGFSDNMRDVLDKFDFDNTISKLDEAGLPYGKDWKRDKNAVETEHERGAGGRFGPGLPRISDGQTLFLLHMLAHAQPRDQGGARIAMTANVGNYPWVPTFS